MKPFVAAVCCTLAFPLLCSSTAFAQEKTAKACQDEWRANKAANQANKITEKAYVEKCRAESAAAKPAAATKPAATNPAPASASTKSSAPTAPAAKTAAGNANQFTAESQAKSRCPLDTVVWVNLKSKIYHFASHTDYGKTKSGAYMCEKDATSQGNRAAKNEKHP